MEELTDQGLRNAGYEVSISSMVCQMMLGGSISALLASPFLGHISLGELFYVQQLRDCFSSTGEVPDGVVMSRGWS